MSLLIALAPAPAGAMRTIEIERLAGPTRYDTAAAIAREYWELGGRRMNVGVLARGDDFADSLAAANVEFGIPLLTERDRLSDATRWIVAELGIVAIEVVGGTAAVSAQVESELEAMGVTVERRAGANRYETAVETYFARYSIEGDIPMTIDGRTAVLLASGERYPDALAAAPLAVSGRLPLLLTRRDDLPAETARIFGTAQHPCPNGICVEQVVIVGGTDAVSDDVADSIRARGVAVRRLAGPTRQATAVAVAEFARNDHPLHWSFSHINLARGDAFPDALAMGRLGGAERAVTLLTESPGSLGDDADRFLAEHRDDVTSIHIAGDESAFNTATAFDARDAASGDVSPLTISAIESGEGERSLTVRVHHADCDIPPRVTLTEWDDRVEVSAVEPSGTCDDIGLTSEVTVDLLDPLGTRLVAVARFIAPRTCTIDGSSSDRCLGVADR